MTIVNSDLCHIRLDRVEAFTAGVAQLSEAARKKGHERPWAAYQVRHGQLGQIAFITLHENWQSLDEQAPPAQLFEEVLGEKKGREIFGEVNASLQSGESIVALERPELSYADEAVITTPPPMLMMNRTKVRAGGQEAYEELVRKVAEAIPKVDDPLRFRAYQTLVGDRRTYAISIPLNGLGEMDNSLTPPELLNNAFGIGEGGLIFRSGREVIEEMETSVSVFLPELSNLPQG